MMWFSWTVIGMCQVITNRYMSHKWEWSQFMHNLLGGISAFLTIFAFGIVYRSKEFVLAWRQMYHTRYGVFALGLSFILFAMGLFAWLKRRFVKPWSTRTMLNIKKAHMYFCLLYTSPSPRDKTQSRMPSSA